LTDRQDFGKTESVSELFDIRRLSPVTFSLCPGNLLNVRNEWLEIFAYVAALFGSLHKCIDRSRNLNAGRTVATGPGWQESARRLVDILIKGSRPMK
jgi:hypothetical protein